MIRSLVYIILIYCVSACRHDLKTHESEFEVSLPDTTNFVSGMTYKLKNVLVKQIGLDGLENNITDSLEIRFWYRVEVLNGGSLLIIKYLDNAWTATQYEYLRKNGTAELDSVWQRKVDPRIEWTELISDLHRFGIDNIQSQGDLDGWVNEVQDGVSYDIEYASRKRYKYYSYNCPDICSDDYIDCVRMFKIVEEMNMAFELDVPFGHKCAN